MAAAILAVPLLPTAAFAASAPTVDVRVRVEGRQETIFDATIRTNVANAVRSRSDLAARRCNARNAGRSPSPRVTATSAAVAALRSQGASFDGNWDSGFDDYFITEFAGERQQPDPYWYWGVLLNDVYAPLGGCQMAMAAGDEVIWANDAFARRPFLAVEGPARAVLGEPTEFTVLARRHAGDGPEGTESGGTATMPVTYAGATLAPVGAFGAPQLPASAAAQVSGAEGTAELTFTQLGWQRVKARTFSIGATASPPAIASASLDVCVAATLAGSCTGPPPSVTPAATVLDPAEEPAPPTPAPTPHPTPTATLAPAATPQPGTTPSPAPRQGEPTPAPALGGGQPGTSPWPGLTVLDDASHRFTYKGGWRNPALAGAVAGRVRLGGQGAKLRVTLPAGRPRLLVWRQPQRSTVQVRVGNGRWRTLTVAASTAAAAAKLTLPALRKRGRLELRVRSGRVAFDGIGMPD